ncbi:MAG TPA: methylated-DNA--[protein]-cysteine S-methyltransferase [Solirubrobacteraceae bacterium]|jgi:methylated-DNA-[protein]-cysteine S-methyltransferase|nr:methylated-DNA--[protein]-cysteine S-methyltransferase [Solirubrobacteraceae bacterium]
MRTISAISPSLDHTTLYETYATPIGTLTLHGSDEHLRRLYFPGRAPISPEPTLHVTALNLVAHQLDEYFAGERQRFELRLAPAGTAFQQRIWELLREIPYGQTTTYGEIARELTVERNGERVEPRAVAGAVSRTPIPIIIPCHRVIGADGSLRGYAGGLDRKRKLLGFESSDGDPRALDELCRDTQLTLM